jgi:putative chitinase
VPVFTRPAELEGKRRPNARQRPAFAGMGNAELLKRVGDQTAQAQAGTADTATKPKETAAATTATTTTPAATTTKPTTTPTTEMASTTTKPTEVAAAEVVTPTAAVTKPEEAQTKAAPTLEQIRAGAVLERGMSGPAVTDLQQRLTKLGFGVQATGTFGSTTETVLRAFQAAYRVEQTGKLGATTLAKLESAELCSITIDQLEKIVPAVDDSVARRYLPFLNASMEQANIDSEARKSAYIAQLAHETDGFNTLEEYASGAEYEGRDDLGNDEEGDGKRYKGRGAIQLTGRANYRAAGEALGVDLEGHPEMASQPELAFRVSAWFWASHDLNKLADDGDFSGITQVVNGGQRGADSREAYHEAAEKALAPKVLAPSQDEAVSRKPARA